MEIYSKRRKAAERAGKPDIYSYGEFPRELRIQVVHVFRGLLGPRNSYGAEEVSQKLWSIVEGELARELGFYTFCSAGFREAVEAWPEWVETASTENVLDLVEVAFAVADYGRGKGWSSGTEPEDAEDSLNRFIREHGFGYRIENGRVIRIDSTFVHEEVVRPALQILTAPGFEGPREEFLRAHENFRHGRGKEALVAACAALESTCKVVLERAGEGFEPKWNASNLIKAVFDQGLVDKSLESLFNALKTVLASGVPTMRGKRGGHGQGAEVAPVPDFFVAYALHQLAAAVVFLVDAAKESGKLSD